MHCMHIINAILNYKKCNLNYRGDFRMGETLYRRPEILFRWGRLCFDTESPGEISYQSRGDSISGETLFRDTGLLRDKLIFEYRRFYPDDNCIFQQDSPPSHRCRLAQQFLQANTPDFIHSDAWPPNSPDLNPLDYYVWNALKELVYAGRRKPFPNTDELKQVIEKNGLY